MLCRDYTGISLLLDMTFIYFLLFDKFVLFLWHFDHMWMSGMA